MADCICFDILFLKNEDQEVVLHAQEYGIDKAEAVRNFRESRQDEYIISVNKHDGSFNPNDN